MVDDGAITPLADRRPGGRRLWLRHHARAAELRTIRSRIAAWAGQQRLPEDVVIDLQLAVGEAVSNGVEHAYLDAEEPDVVPTVEVELEVLANEPLPVVAVMVTDHGRWRPAPDRPGYRGRGLTVIDRLSRRLQVVSSRQGTRVCFEVPLRPF
ncbi:ATP-binding protein [Pseudonocardia yunnanensis]|uniref:ATP-binding protein n=1 Tax=Pseudonocardia yunnanensis TaxID=58107 RepID=A0ABW4ENT8_9PSEU